MMVQSSWPLHIHKALSSTSTLALIEGDFHVEAFKQRWGGLELDALLRGITSDRPQERVFALFALGYLGAQEARPYIRTVIRSMDPEERWAAAISLGHLRDAEAVPHLSVMLAEFLPRDIEGSGARRPLPEQTRFEYWRPWVPILLGDLGDAQAVPPLREALKLIVQLLGQERMADSDLQVFQRARPQVRDMPREDWARIRELLTGFRDRQVFDQIQLAAQVDSDLGKAHRTDLESEDEGWAEHRRYLISFQDEIVYSLGRLGAFGALTDIRAGTPFLQVWTVHLALGHLQLQYGPKDIVGGTFSPKLESSLRKILQAQYGLPRSEQDHALTLYRLGKFAIITLKLIERQAALHG